MKSLKDQLNDWKKTHDAKPEAAKGQAAAKPGQKPAAKPPEKIQAAAPPPPPPKPKKMSDAELFRTALDAIDDDAVLAKYDAAVASLPEGLPPPEPPPDDAALFARFVGEIRPVDVNLHKPPSGPPSAAEARLERRLERGDTTPDAQIDLHGVDRVKAMERLQAFLTQSSRKGLSLLLIIHGKGTGVVEEAVRKVLDEHKAIAEHVQAPAALGGSGARVVRLKRPRA